MSGLTDNGRVRSDGFCTMANTNSGMQLLCVIKKAVLRLLFNKEWSKSRISYYWNSDATHNHLSILLSGDVHLFPGPDSANMERIAVRSTTRRHVKRSSGIL